MPNRTAGFVSAIVTGVIAGAPLTATITSTPARAADECLAAPKGPTPEGSHWYYRIEHPSNRHCWYMRGDADAPAPATASNVPAAKPASPKPETPMPGSVANARAELNPMAAFDNPSVNTGQLPAAAPVADTDKTEAASPADTVPTSVVAARWPDQPSPNTAAAPAPSPAPSSITANPTAEAQVNGSPLPQASAAAPVAPLDTTDAPLAKQSSSFVMLLAVIVGGLSVAGLVASVVFRSGGKRRTPAPKLEELRPVWDLDRDLKRRVALAFPASAADRPNIGAPVELQETDDIDDRDRIAQMLARLARSAQV